MPTPLKLTLTQLEKLTDTYGTPLYVYDKNGIEKNAQNFMKTFKSYIPSFKQYFAVKALPNLAILEILQKCGMGFDCSSPTEIQLVNELSGKPEILYSSNYTSVEDFVCVLGYDNIIINLDDIDGLDNLMDAVKLSKRTVPEIISFRLNPNIGKTDSETKSNVLGGAESKFGICQEKIIDAYLAAKTHGIKRFGIHVMTGSCVMNIDYWKDLIDVIFTIMNTIYIKAGINFEFVDLGGGIGIPYKQNENHVSIDHLARTISLTIKSKCDKLCFGYHPAIYMENGRYITGPYGWLISKCKSIKTTTNCNFYGLDACMSNLMRCGMYGAYHHITIPRLHYKEDLESANVVGTLCENNDWFAKDRMLPKGIRKNDIFVIYDTGAHGHCMGFQYNGKLRSSEVLCEVNNGVTSCVLIRKRETYDYLIQNQTKDQESCVL
jgi:diaminopimelate decarboxylase